MSEQRLVLHRGTPHVVIETSGTLIRIHAQDKDEWSAFWVREETVKPYLDIKAAKAAKQLQRAASAPHALLVEPDREAWQAFVQYLNRAGYTLNVAVREDGVEKAEAEYRAWTGEELPLDKIRLAEGLLLNREWRLGFKLEDGTSCPFPIDIAGCGPQRPTAVARGLIRDGSRVNVYFASIVEELVRAGLRA